jgi:hypothetical protein
VTRSAEKREEGQKLPDESTRREENQREEGCIRGLQTFLEIGGEIGEAPVAVDCQRRERRSRLVAVGSLRAFLTNWEASLVVEKEVARVASESVAIRAAAVVREANAAGQL